ncbi:multiple coagulation factor deficiency protein 2 [Caerostris darwini]|uniref:Multiple coagulation factor deficiency protein 2 n=1 Tax=Caerostris darwini TaxID=1538125 RepID=A0AAV4THP2_9ARAC|nr:multiple coagulation factor deficiency protein 2 [Caerostris darwini]
MNGKIYIFITLAIAFLKYVSCSIESDHQPRLMTTHSHLDERHHIGQHMEGVVDVTQMAEDELRFLYFKMHDSDNNNKLDGCELIKSLLHFHVEECKAMGPEHAHGTTKVFGHDELSRMIDPILSTDDKNFDGFVDYPEFVDAQKSRGF